MKVARKSPKRRPAKRAPLTLPEEGYRAVDELRGDLSRSAYLHGLLEREKARRQREAFVVRANAQCTEAFCREAVRLNAVLPFTARHEAGSLLVPPRVEMSPTNDGIRRVAGARSLN